MLQYEKGQYETAVQLLSQTSIRKNPEAQTMLGELYANGLGVEKNIGMAIQHLTRASDHNSHAAFLLGTLFEKGDERSRKSESSHPLVQKKRQTGRQRCHKPAWHSFGNRQRH